MSINSAFTSLIRAFLVSSFLLPISACVPLDGRPSGNASSTLNASNKACNYSTYRIGAGDILVIDINLNADLSDIIEVQDDGTIFIPLAGDVVAGDRSVEEVTTVITQKLKKYIRDPIVTVIVMDLGDCKYQSRVRVVGAVQKPIAIPYRQGMSVLGGVLKAGGTNKLAELRKATLFRRDGTRLPIRLDRIIQGSDMATNHTMRAGDVVHVPEITPK